MQKKIQNSDQKQSAGGNTDDSKKQVTNEENEPQLTTNEKKSLDEAEKGETVADILKSDGASSQDSEKNYTQEVPKERLDQIQSTLNQLQSDQTASSKIASDSKPQSSAKSGSHQENSTSATRTQTSSGSSNHKSDAINTNHTSESQSNTTSTDHTSESQSNATNTDHATNSQNNTINSDNASNYPQHINSSGSSSNQTDINSSINDRSEIQDVIYARDYMVAFIRSLKNDWVTVSNLEMEDQVFQNELCYKITVKWEEDSSITKTFWVGSHTLKVYDQNGEEIGTIYQDFNPLF